MDVGQLVDAILAVNHLSTIASIACVLLTYFLDLRPAAYRCILFLGIVFGLATLAIGMTTVVWPLPYRYSREDALFPIVVFSPFVIVLIGILARIRRASSETCDARSYCCASSSTGPELPGWCSSSSPRPNPAAGLRSPFESVDAQIVMMIIPAIEPASRPAAPQEELLPWLP
jgi:hypothetical protein